jgi:hypothetical protein
VFLDETGLLLGLTRTHARSQMETRAYSHNPFLMTMNDSMDGKDFVLFVEKFLVPNLWSGAVVVMDNLFAHKLDSIPA